MTARRGAVDRRIGWRILLSATLPEAPDPTTLAERLATLARAQAWSPAPPVRSAATADELRRALVAADPAPLVVGLAGRELVLSGDHAAMDGLGLLAVLDRLGAGPATSAVRGVGARPPGAGVAATVVRRLGEALVRPPAGVGPGPGTTGTPTDTPTDTGDALAEAELDGRFRTGALVHAASRAIVAHEARRGRRARRVAVAVGATLDPAPKDERIRDRSALLRLRDVETLDRAGIDQALRTAPVQTPPAARTRGPWSRPLEAVGSIAMQALAPRLGSTLLVSHLGPVTAPHVERLSIHPVTAGGSGLSLGAVGLDGRTVLTLRARASRWTDDGLEQLLEAVISLLREAPVGPVSRE